MEEHILHLPEAIESMSQMLESLDYEILHLCAVDPCYADGRLPGWRVKSSR